MHSYESLRKVFDVIANSENKTPDGYLLDSLGSLFDFSGGGLNKEQWDIRQRFRELTELGVIVNYQYTPRRLNPNYHPTKRTTDLMKVVISDFSWEKFLELTDSNTEILDREDIRRLLITPALS